MNKLLGEIGSSMQFSDGTTIESIIAGVNDLTFSEAEEAINQLTAQGITQDSELPFSRITYNHAEKNFVKNLVSLAALLFLK